MANPLRGEVDVQVGDKSYVLRFSINAMVAAESVMGLGISDIIAELQASPKLGTLRTVMWAGLREYQPKITLDAVGDIIGELGLQKAGEIIGDALAKAFPAGDGARPSLGTTQG